MTSKLKFLQPVVDGLLLFAVVIGLPFAWIIRDGLGPDSISTSGIAAIDRTLSTFFIGPIILLLTSAALILRSQQPYSRFGQHAATVPVAIFVAILALCFSGSFWAGALLGIYAVFIGPTLAVARPKLSRRALQLTTISLPLITLLLYYSLAIHMHHRFDGWPQSIGMHGFPPSLAIHADVALFFYFSLLVGCVFTLPPAGLLFAYLPRLRPGWPYYKFFAITWLAVYALSFMAPENFEYWLWD